MIEFVIIMIVFFDSVQPNRKFIGNSFYSNIDRILLTLSFLEFHRVYSIISYRIFIVEKQHYFNVILLYFISPRTTIFLVFSIMYITNSIFSHYINYYKKSTMLFVVMSSLIMLAYYLGLNLTIIVLVWILFYFYMIFIVKQKSLERIREQFQSSRKGELLKHVTLILGLYYIIFYMVGNFIEFSPLFKQYYFIPYILVELLYIEIKLDDLIKIKKSELKARLRFIYNLRLKNKLFLLLNFQILIDSVIKIFVTIAIMAIIQRDINIGIIFAQILTVLVICDVLISGKLINSSKLYRMKIPTMIIVSYAYLVIPVITIYNHHRLNIVISIFIIVFSVPLYIRITRGLGTYEKNL